METNKNTVLVASVLMLVLGLGIGYFVGADRSRYAQAPTSTVSGMHGAMGGMMMGLEGKVGDELDLAFLNEMIVHHQGAVEMAQTLLRNTKRPELIKLGNDIITAQTQEIQMMDAWRKDWFSR